MACAEERREEEEEDEGARMMVQQLHPQNISSLRQADVRCRGQMLQELFHQLVSSLVCGSLDLKINK